MLYRLFYMLIFVICLGCGSETTTQSESVSEMIRANEGGEIITPSGDARLVIPPGALEHDLLVTVKEIETVGLPDEDRLDSRGFAFGPAKTVLSRGATMELILRDELPEGKIAVLARLDGSRWIDVESSYVENKTVSSQINILSTYAIVFKSSMAFLREKCKMACESVVYCDSEENGGKGVLSVYWLADCEAACDEADEVDEGVADCLISMRSQCDKMEGGCRK